MHSHKDIENKSIFVINGTRHQSFRVQNGLLAIVDTKNNIVQTKLPFPKMLCIMIIGHASITTAFIHTASRYGIPIVVMKPNFRIVFHYGDMSEGNYLLRRRQHHWDKQDLGIAKILIRNKIENAKRLLLRTKRKSATIDVFLNSFENSLEYIQNCKTLSQLMAAEGRMASYFFSAYYEKQSWKMRIPRAKIDFLNSTMDIGYTFLFNYIEANCRFFGFDLYVGVLHQLWFQRKSLVCDLQEPFRCIIDHCIYLATNKGQITEEDFRVFKGSWYLKPESKNKFTHLFFEAIIPYKMHIFKYIQSYYRCFMKNHSPDKYPTFEI